MIQSYRDLLVWQKAMQLAEEVYAMSTRLPDIEKYGLASQMRRAAVSIPSSLAEGHARSSTKEFARYVSIAMGSLAEIDTQLQLSARLGYMSEADIFSLLERCDEQGRMLRGLRKSLDSKIDQSRSSP
ncbi:four helix bundle protein [Dokdonella sp.]|uniref:four helix bundle protein n=1 Tax=Dokdonella sp. TaxID=2291710 RepID=UPI003783852B